MEILFIFQKKEEVFLFDMRCKIIDKKEGNFFIQFFFGLASEFVYISEFSLKDVKVGFFFNIRL